MPRQIHHGGKLPTLCLTCMETDINLKKGRLTEQGYMETLRPERIRAMQSNRSGTCALCWVVSTITKEYVPGDEICTCYLRSHGHLTELLIDRQPRLQLFVVLDKRKLLNKILAPNTDYVGDPEALLGIGPLPQLGNSSASEEVVSFVKTSLEACLKDHHDCRKKDGRLPRRLLKINSPAKGYARLMYPGTNFNARYSALSYCWGQSTTYTTSQSTISEHKRGIKISVLPRTIQDAIVVAQSIDCAFIWVDALCIVQDDPEDWEKESSLMASIYANAFVTISAASAATVNEGFLRKIERQEMQLEWLGSANETKCVHVRRLPVEHDIRGFREPLEGRAWALQESLLSTRLLSFGQSEVRWKCKSNASCQCGTTPSYASKQQEIARMESAPEAHNIWQDIVFLYNRRALTMKTDILPALAGLARVFNEHIKSKYLAGLWETFLLEDLVWWVIPLGQTVKAAAVHSFPEGDDKDTLEMYSAPSYSWASLVRQHLEIMTPHGATTSRTRDTLSAYNQHIWSAKVVSTSATPSGPDPFGKVSNGWITISGYLHSVKIVSNSLTHPFIGAEYGVDMMGTIRTFRADAPLTNITHGTASGSHVTSLVRANKLVTTATSCIERTVYLLYLGFRRLNNPHTPGSGVDNTHMFIVLGKLGREPHVYQRIGILKQEILKCDPNKTPPMPLSEYIEHATVTIE